MKIGELIRLCGKRMESLVRKWMEADSVNKTADMLEAYKKDPSNVPLAPEDLQEMDGRPAFYYRIRDMTGEWVLVSWDDGRPMLVRKNGAMSYAAIALMYGNLLYRYPPDGAIPLTFPALRG